MRRVPADEPTYPHPARFWWFKRLTALGLVVLVVLTLVRLAWGRHMAQRLATAEMEVRARGGAVSVEELNRPSGISPAANAATYFNSAITALRPVYGPSSSTTYWAAEYPPYPPAWHKLAAAAVAANRPAFAQARAARPFARADWGLRYANPLLSPPTTTISRTRHLANQLADAALYEHLQSNDAAGVEYARDVLHLARSVDQETTLIHHLVAEGIEAVALQRLMIIAPAMHVVPGDDVPVGVAAPAGAATRGQVEAVIRDLLDAPSPGLGTAAALQGAEAVLVRDTLHWATRSNWVISPAGHGLEQRVHSVAPAYARAPTQPTPTHSSHPMPAP
jgi:hypothetical protein